MVSHIGNPKRAAPSSVGWLLFIEVCFLRNSVGQVLSLSSMWRWHDCRTCAVVCASSPQWQRADSTVPIVLVWLRSLQWPVLSWKIMVCLWSASWWRGLVVDYSLYFCAWRQLASCSWWAYLLLCSLALTFGCCFLLPLFASWADTSLSCILVCAGIHWSTSVVLGVRLLMLCTRLCWVLRKHLNKFEHNEIENCLEHYLYDYLIA